MWQCFDCCSNLAREAHTGHRGTYHGFELRRLGRYCNHCKEMISSDFLMCTACRQDQDCFDLVSPAWLIITKSIISITSIFSSTTSCAWELLSQFDDWLSWQCYTCAFSANAILLHQSVTSPEHQFRPIQWRHYIPFRAPCTFKTIANWWCNVCSRTLNRSFFHCIGCGTGPNGYDLVCLYIIVLVGLRWLWSISVLIARIMVGCFVMEHLHNIYSFMWLLWYNTCLLQYYRVPKWCTSIHSSS
jgi:hypothetical protein